MPTIQGPIVIKKGEFANFIKEAIGEVKLPFKATGWESTEGMEVIPDEYKKASAKKKKKKVKAQPTED